MTQKEWKLAGDGLNFAAIMILIIFGIDPASSLLWALLGLCCGLGIGALDFSVTAPDRREKDNG